MFRSMCTSWYRLTEFEVSVRPIVLGEKISYFRPIVYSANMSSIDSSSPQSALTIEASHFVTGLHFLHDYRRLEGCHLDQRVPGRLHVLLLPHRRHHRRVRRRWISRSFQVRSWSRPEIQSTNQLIRTGDSTLNQIST